MGRHGFDMSFVAPSRHDEIARRIRILQMYTQAPSRLAAIEGAREIGIGLVAFYNLAKAWRNAPRPKNVARSGRPRVRRSTMSAAQIGIVDEAIGVAFHQSPAGIVDFTYTLAAAAGIELPARNIIRRRVDRTKPASIPIGAVADGADFVLDEIDRVTGGFFYGELERTPGGSVVIFVEIMDIDRESYCIDAAYMTLAALEAAINVGRIVLPGDPM